MDRPHSGLIDRQGALVEGAGGVGVALVVQNARGLPSLVAVAGVLGIL